MYVFVFKNAVGCRTVKSEYHASLPACTGEPLSDTELLHLKSVANVANSFFYTNPDDGPKIEYCSDGNYTLSYRAQCTNSGIPEAKEDSRAKVCIWAGFNSSLLFLGLAMFLLFYK